ncbi:MAG: hypothetical protein WCH46_04170 [bacterium]
MNDVPIPPQVPALKPKNKKPPVWVWILAAVFIIAFIGSMGKKSETASSSSSDEITTSISGASAILEFRPSTTWDEETLLKEHFSKAITYGRKVFPEHPEVKLLIFRTYYKLQDVNGNEKETIVMKHVFAREPFMEVHWEKFTYSPVFDQITKSLDGTGYIHPGVAKKISSEYTTNKMYYAP